MEVDLGESLLPRTLRRVFPGGAPPDVEAQDLVSLQRTFLEQFLGGSEEVVQQAKSILSSPDPVNMHPEKEGGAIVENNKLQNERRRQGLGRKRARFSMKPASRSQEPADIGLKLNIENLADPDDYFSAVEKIEIAEKELKKLRGQSLSDLPENHQFAAVRHRRPGILGKTASHRHSFALPIDNKEDFLPSRGPVEKINSSQEKASSDIGYSNHSQDSIQLTTSQGIETIGSELFDAIEREGPVAEKESKVNILLDTLLSSIENLDEHDGAILLQERLQLKQINVDKIRLPVTPVLKTQRDSADTANGDMMEHKADKHLIHAMPSLHRSPFSAISLLRKQASQSDSPKDPYLSPPTDRTPSSRRSSSIINVNMHTQVDDMTQKSSIFGKLGPRFKELDSGTPCRNGDNSLCGSVDRNTDCTGLHRLEGKSFSNPSRQALLDDKSNGMLIDVSMSGKVPSSEGQDSGILNQHGREGLAGQFDSCVDCTEVPGPDCPVAPDSDAHNLHDRMISDVFLEASGSGTQDQHEGEVPVCPFDSSLNCSELLEPDGPVQPGSCNLDDGMSNPHQERESQDFEGLKDGHPDTSSILAAEKNGKRRMASLVPNSKKAPSKRSCKGSYKGRKSLAEAGTKWESGLRKSTRIKFRPLEYWRGERFLYGRIHDSLATVIGVKYSSPGEAAKLKVKSYVSEQYLDLVESAALH